MPTCRPVRAPVIPAAIDAIAPRCSQPWEPASGGGALLIDPGTLAPPVLLDERGLTVGTGYSAWANQGSAGGNFAQATGANQPATGRSINGYAAPDFDGSNDTMASSFNASVGSTTTSWELFLVFNADALAADPTPTTWYTAPALISCASPAPWAIGVSASGVWVGADESGTYKLSSQSPIYADASPVAHVLNARFDSGTLYIQIDGDKVHTFAGVGTLAALSVVLRLGSNYSPSAYHNGAIAALSMWQTPLSSSQRAGVQRWYAAKYGITLAPAVREVMWCGDSITANSVASSLQWRKAVQDATTLTGYYRAIGPLVSANVAFPRDRSMSGGGYTIANLKAAIDNDAAYAVGTRILPDVYAIMIGTNDMGLSAHTNATIQTDYLALLSDIKTRSPSALVVCQKLTPRTDTTPLHNQVEDFNTNYLPGIVSTAVSGGQNAILDTTLYDLVTAGTVTLMGDGLHPATGTEATVGAAMEARVRAWCGL